MDTKLSDSLRNNIILRCEGRSPVNAHCMNRPTIHSRDTFNHFWLEDFTRVIGIELVPEAVEDAKLNAKINGIMNAEFHAGRAEDLIRDIMKTLPSNCDICAVVDPPRAGLHTTVIQTLRYCQRLERIIFVSCDLDGAMSNFIDFARPTSKRFQGPPFIPVHAEVIDLFPQTRHFEVLLVLERFAQYSETY